MMEEGVREIVFEKHLHSSGPCVPNYPSHQVNQPWSVYSRSITMVKQGWRGQKHQGKQSKPVSLYVVTGNYITLLHKDLHKVCPASTDCLSSLQNNEDLRTSSTDPKAFQPPVLSSGSRRKQVYWCSFTSSHGLAGVPFGGLAVIFFRLKDFVLTATQHNYQGPIPRQRQSRNC